ncbi:LysR family transcriptional regulator [Myxococcus stipitatus DSM 14675]|uniref:LysR family transcriptional regulator n=1 Tax=Myxococcus stipitatus (strain DSM 14675 / JCM 12634 / Mx s8) TaxID=1278073 RepID=L7UB92_MYXSD|nr:LysR family transcriptional regulator [Myxococcus stipitatus]AGC45323.1 LysR family transcriptional regulator [Myxococcus stipitatus DSM 14675]
MHSVDANLLLALDALLREGSVMGAARRMNLSPPAMSRTLQRLRDATGDPLLVRAGRRMVPTPRALAMRERVQDAAREVCSLLGPPEALVLGTLSRTFTLRTSDYLLVVLGNALDRLVREEAPQVRLTFAPEGSEDVESLRSGDVDLDMGVQGQLGPELRVRKLFDDEMVAVVRQGHSLTGAATPRRLVKVPHVVVSRRGKGKGVLDDALAKQGLARRVERIVPSYFSAARLVAGSDLIGIVPRRFAQEVAPGFGLRMLELGVELPRLTLSLAWHPRFDGDAAHQWLREGVVRASVAGRVRNPRSGSPVE